MKKIICFVVFLIGVPLFAATTPRNNLGLAEVKRVSFTGGISLATLNANAPDTTYQMVICTDCTQTPVCISSGIGTGAWVTMAATGTFAGATWGGIPHCR